MTINLKQKYIQVSIRECHGKHKSKTTKEKHKTKREETKITKNFKYNWKISNKMAESTYLSVITLNAPVKRHKMVDWIKYKTHLRAAYSRLISELKTHRD